jgi:hypothetical protein
VISFNWSFPSLDVVHNQVDEQTGLAVQNVVTTVHWIYTARDGDYTATMYSTVGLPGPGQPFTAYEDLTSDIVQGWVESTLGADQVAEMQKSLANSIEAQKTPQGGSMTPPWEK